MKRQFDEVNFETLVRRSQLGGGEKLFGDDTFEPDQTVMVRA